MWCNLQPIDLMKEHLQRGNVEELVTMLTQPGAEKSFRVLGQTLLWQSDFSDFEKLLQVGLTLKEGEALLLDLGFQLVPPGLPDSSWATSPLREQLEAGYNMIGSALSSYPEPAAIFRRVVEAQQADIKRLSDDENPRRGWG